jgi:hypothetical protein
MHGIEPASYQFLFQDDNCCLKTLLSENSFQVPLSYFMQLSEKERVGPKLQQGTPQSRVLASLRPPESGDFG